MFTYVVGGDQNRAKGRINFELIRWPETPESVNTTMLCFALPQSGQKYQITQL